MEDQILDSAFHEDNDIRLFEATKGQRFAHYFIDIIVYYIFSGALGLLLGILGNGRLLLELADDVFFTYFFGFISMTIYYSFFEYFTKGKTLGKFITKTRVVTEEGYRPTYANILGRTLCRMIPFEPFSFLGQSARGWHDTISKTMVIDESMSVLPTDEFV